MTSSEVARQRLSNQRIAGSKCRTVAEVVSTLGAVQAQDFPASQWAIGLRWPSATLPDIQAALAERTIVRTWLLRGTLHIVTASDIRWMLDLLASRNIAASAGRHRQLNLDEATFAKSARLLSKALKSEPSLTRDAMLEILEKGKVRLGPERGYHILWRLAQEGLLCFGPHEEKQATFVLLEDALPPGRPLDRHDALAELARRYFKSHGPARLHDFATWSGLKIADARIGLEAVAPELGAMAVDGVAYWGPAQPASALPDAHSAYLLPGFDEYIIGYQHRGDVIDPNHFPKIVSSGNGRFNPMLVLGGQVAGTWTRTLARGNVSVKLDPFRPLTRQTQKAFKELAGQYAKFLGVELKIT